MSTNKYFFGTALIFFVATFSIFTFYVGQYYNITGLDAGEMNDRLLLKEFQESAEIEKYFTISRLQNINVSHGNIFSYFELPANLEGIIVPLKGAGRLFMRAPMYIMTGGYYFWSVWKIVSMILIGGFILIYTKKYQLHVKLLLLLAGLVLVPYFSFDLEFGAFFISIISIIIWGQRKNELYFITYLIFGAVSCLMRYEFFIFYSLSALYSIFPLLRQKKAMHIYILGGWMVFILTTILMINKIYNGDYFRFGYAVEKEGGINVDGLKNTGILMKFIFPYGINMGSIVDSVAYVMNSIYGVIIILGVISWKQKNNNIQLVFVLLIYCFIFYGSNPYFARGNVYVSSYTRYFSTFLLLLYTVSSGAFFSKIPTKKLKTLIIIVLFFMLIPGQHFFSEFRTMKNRAQWVQEVSSKIPERSYIFAGSKGRSLLFNNYLFFYPSGSDVLDTEKFHRNPGNSDSIYIDKVVIFVKKEKRPLYIIEQGSYSKNIILYLEKNGFEVVQDSSNLFWIANYFEKNSTEKIDDYLIKKT